MPRFTLPPNQDRQKLRLGVRRRYAWLTFVLIFLGILAALWLIRAVLLPFILAAVIAYVFEPMVTRFESAGIRRFGGVIIIYTVLVLAIGGFVQFLVPVLETESTKVLSELNRFVRNAPNYYERLEAGVGDFVDSVTSGQDDATPVQIATPISEDAWGFGPPLDRFREASAPAVPLLREVGLAGTPEELSAAGLDRAPLETFEEAQDLTPRHSLTVEPTPDGAFGIRFNQATFQIKRSGDDTLSIVASTKVNEASRFDNLRPQITKAMREGLEQLGGSILKGFFSFFQGLVTGILGGLLAFLVVFMVAAFLLVDAPNLKRTSRRLIPPRFRPDYDELLSRMDQGLSGVVRGQLLICLINGILSGIGYAIFIPEYAIVLAIVSGVLSLIPIFGTIISSIPAVIIGLTVSFSTGLGVLAWILGIHFIEANILNPKVIGSQAHLHPALVILVLVAGESLFGIKGALLAVPVTSVAQNLIMFTHSRIKGYLI
ncbi:MAG: AI-2E family transporter [Pseudomonadota bacterium]